MEEKRVAFNLDEESYMLWKQIAREEYRSVSKQTMIAVKAYISHYLQEKQERALAVQSEEEV